MRNLLPSLPQAGLRKPRSVLLVWLLLWALHPAECLDPNRNLQHYRRQSWQVDNGLPQSSVHAILQTRDGFLWLATEGGLVRFDGVDFRVFDTSNTPQFHSNFVNGLVEDRDGALWIGTSNGLLRLKNNRFNIFTVADGLPSNTVTAIHEQSNGRLIVLTNAGMAIHEDARFSAISGTEFLSNIEAASALAEDSQGDLWLAGRQEIVPIPANAKTAGHPIKTRVGTISALNFSSNGDLWVGGADGLECFRNGLSCPTAQPGDKRMQTNTLAAHDVTALLPAGSGDEMWVGTSSGLAQISGGMLRQFGLLQGLAGVDIQRLFLDRSGALWVMFNRGLARVFNDKVQIAPEQTSIKGVLSIFQDQEGDMWFGSETDGLSILRDQMFSSITTRQGLSADFIRTVFQDRSGTIWIGTNNGGLDRFSEKNLSAQHVEGELSSNVVLALAETGDDLWVGTPDGLTRIRKGSSQVFTTADGMADNFVRSLYADKDGSLWVGTRNGLSHLQNGSFKSYSTSDGLGSDVIGSVVRSASGDLWVGTLGGLSRLTGDRFVNYTTKDGLGGDVITALFEDDEGSLWIGTNRNGLTRFRSGKFFNYPRTTGMPETIYGILEDALKNLWMSSPRGVYRVSIRALNTHADDVATELPVVNYGVADGMQISECSSGGHPSVWHMQDGTLWFATLKGVTWVDPRVVVGGQHPPKVAIEGVTFDDRSGSLSTLPADDGASIPEVIVPAGGRRLTIHYAGLSFFTPQKVRYRYKLMGFDRDWVQAGAGRTAYYTNVPPGRYRFTVAASTAEGKWSIQPASLELRLQPQFIQTGWFYGLLGLALAGLAYAVYRIRVHYVEARLKAVMAERGRIAREIHDTLAQGYVGIAIQLEIALRLLENSHSAAMEQLKQTKELVRNSLAEARSSIWDLRSQGKDSEILPTRIAAAVKSRQSKGGPLMSFQVHGIYRPLSNQIEEQIFRVAQEAINNSIRHARARRIEVTLTFDQQMLLLSVWDDGCGFNSSFDSFADGGHFGIKGMRERAATIGAALNVAGDVAQGTLVTLRLEMHKQGKTGVIN
jgi:ligand-binding sensor domain-containing protein/signal transduction histidine kinase